jgi:hypothetical protein
MNVAYYLNKVIFNLNDENGILGTIECFSYIKLYVSQIQAQSFSSSRLLPAAATVQSNKKRVLSKQMVLLHWPAVSCLLPSSRPPSTKHEARAAYCRTQPSRRGTKLLGGFVLHVNTVWGFSSNLIHHARYAAQPSCCPRARPTAAPVVQDDDLHRTAGQSSGQREGGSEPAAQPLPTRQVESRISRPDFIRIPSAGGCQKRAGSRDCTGEVSPSPAPPPPGAQGAPGRSQARAGQRNTRHRARRPRGDLQIACVC